MNEKIINCPICGNEAIFFISKEDNFSQVYEYFRCKGCRFLFDKDLYSDSENLQKKIIKIYQNDYDKIDFGWKERGDNFSKTINKLIRVYRFFCFKKKLSVLDYGAGSGYITSKIDKKFDVSYYDKYANPEYKNSNYKILRNPQKSDIVLAIEVLEHISNPNDWQDMIRLAKRLAVFTTELSDGIEDKDLADWWYLKPEVGHTCVYSSRSLRILAKKHGFAYVFFPSKSFHIFFKNYLISKVNFIKLEYPIYNLIRKIKKCLSK